MTTLHGKISRFLPFFFEDANIYELTSVFPDGGIIFSSTALYQCGITMNRKTGFSSEIIAKLLIFMQFRYLLAIWKSYAFITSCYPILNYSNFYIIHQPFSFLIYNFTDISPLLEFSMWVQ